MSAAKALFNITMTTGRGTSEKSLSAELVSVGRAPDCQLRIHNDNVSRKHLTFISKENKVWMEDHGSANGTFLNGQKVPAHTLICISSADEVRLGNSDVQLHVDAKEENAAPSAPMTLVREETMLMFQDQLPPTPDIPEGEIENSEDYLNADLPVAPVAPKAPLASKPSDFVDAIAPKVMPAAAISLQHEALLKEAQKKSAQIVFEAESEAEKRVQEIYARAHESQKRAEDFYRQRLQEAYAESQKCLQDSQEQGQGLLTMARQKSQQIRDEVEAFAARLRTETEDECADILDEATARSREIKDQKIQEAEAQIQAKETEIREALRKEAEDERVQKTQELEQHLQETRKAHEEQIASESSAHHDQIDALKEKIEKLNEELHLSEAESRRRLDEIQTQIKNAANVLDARQIEQSQQKEASEKLEQEIKKAQTDLQNRQHEFQENDKNLEVQKQLLKTQAEQIQKSKQEAEHFTSEARTLKNNHENLQKEHAAELNQLKEKFAHDRQKIEKQEEERTQQLRLEATQQVRKLERDLLDELHGKKDRLSREILLTLEASMREHIPAVGWSENAAALQEQIASILSGQIVTISKDAGLGEKKKQLVSERKKERWMSVTMGILVGVLVLFAGQHLWNRMHAGKSPLQQMANDEVQKQQKDLEARRYQPAQTRDVRDNYTDSILYTENFVTIYLDPTYQQKWFKAGTAYLLKTWRLDEDHSFQTLSMASALVKNLADRRQKIHPDFVKEGITKMRETETQNLARMREVLGSEVRLESFQKFEREFYQQEVLQRGH